jgi:transcriptional regulator with XRE-family HTH domain
VARPEKDPKTPLAERLREVRRVNGDPDRAEVAQRLGVSLNSLSRYERGELEPSCSTLQAYCAEYGVNLHWLLTGSGTMLVGGNQTVENIAMPDVRKYIWNIADTFWSKAPRRTKPEDFANQFLEMFDYLVSRKDVKDDAASEVIDFAAQQLKRASSQDE